MAACYLAGWRRQADLNAIIKDGSLVQNSIEWSRWQFFCGVSGGALAVYKAFPYRDFKVAISLLIHCLIILVKR